MMFRHSSFALVLTVGSSLAASALAEPSKAPFPLRAVDAKAVPRSCPVVPDPVVQMELPSKYGQSGSRRDTVDAEAESAFEDAMAPIKSFLSDVTKTANDFQRSGRQSAADCTLDLLLAWARADALREPLTHTSWFKLSTTLTGLSMALMQVDPALSKRAADRKLVAEWLAARAGALQRYFDALKMPRASRNNHRAWAALAAASVGVVAEKRALIGWAEESFKLVVCQATAEGALPLELERGAKATEYHLYALAALTPLAEILSRQGKTPYAQCDDALHRVARFTMKGLSDPASVAALAGKAQTGAGLNPTPSRLVFLEPYLARFPDALPGARAYLSRRPFGLSDLGGNQTLLYAR